MAKKDNCIDLLFSRSNFLIGAGSIMGLMGNYYEFNFPKNSRIADAKAIRSDWRAVGDDLRTAMRSFNSSHKDKHKNNGNKSN